MPEIDRTLECDARSLSRPDIGAIDRLCRMALAARRMDRHFRVVNAPPELGELVELCGLAAVVPCTPGSGSETVG